MSKIVPKLASILCLKIAWSKLSSYFQSQILSDILSYWDVQDVVGGVDWPTLKVFAFLI